MAGEGVGYSFKVTIDGVELSHVQEVSGLKLELDMFDVNENDAKGNLITTRVPGRHKGGDIQITRAVVEGEKQFHAVLAESFAGLPTANTKGGSVEIMDQTGKTLVMITIPPTALFTKLEGSAGKAADTSVKTHKATLAHPGLHISAANIIL